MKNKTLKYGQRKYEILGTLISEIIATDQNLYQYYLQIEQENQKFLITEVIFEQKEVYNLKIYTLPFANVSQNIHEPEEAFDGIRIEEEMNEYFSDKNITSTLTILCANQFDQTFQKESPSNQKKENPRFENVTYLHLFFTNKIDAQNVKKQIVSIIKP